MINSLMALKKEYKATIVLALPVVFGQLSSLLMNITDNVIVGELGAGALSSSSFANACFYLVAVFGFGAMNAIPSLVAEARGAKDDNAIRQNLRAGLWSSFGIGILIGVLTYLLALAMPYMNQPESDVALGKPFLVLMAFSAPFMIMGIGIKGFFDGLEETKIGMLISIFGLFLNVFLNYGLIFGKFGFPEWGFIGSAWATLISRVVVFVCFAWVLFYTEKFRSYTFLQQFDIQYLVHNLKLGVPMGLQILFEVAAFSGAGIMIGWLGGETAIIGRAAHQITLNMASITYMGMLGLSVAGSVRVGEAYGRKDREGILNAGKATLILALVFVTMASTFLVVYRYEFTKIYRISDPKVLEVTVRLMLLAAIFQVFDGVQCISAGLLRGIQDVKVPTFLTFLAYWVLWIPVAYYLTFNLQLGVDGVWIGDVIALAFAAVALSWRFFRLVKIKEI